MRSYEWHSMLAPSDAISVEIIKLINRHIESESGDIEVTTAPDGLVI